MKRHGARLTVKAKLRLKPVSELPPQLAAYALPFRRSDIRMKKRLRRPRRRRLHLHVDEGVAFRVALLPQLRAALAAAQGNDAAGGTRL